MSEKCASSYIILYSDYCFALKFVVFTARLKHTVHRVEKIYCSCNEGDDVPANLYSNETQLNLAEPSPNKTHNILRKNTQMIHIHA